MLLLIISTWQTYFAVPSCMDDEQDGNKWLSWLWMSVKLMWCIMCPILLGTWHRIAVLKTSEHSLKRCTNLEQDVSLKSELAKNWHSRYSFQHIPAFVSLIHLQVVSAVKRDKYTGCGMLSLIHI